MKVHADEGSGSDYGDTNNSNQDNDGEDSNNNSNADDDNDVAISAPNVLADVQLAKTVGTYCISSHFHLLI